MGLYGTPRMENQMKNQMHNDAETGIMKRLRAFTHPYSGSKTGTPNRKPQEYDRKIRTLVGIFILCKSSALRWNAVFGCALMSFLTFFV